MSRKLCTCIWAWVCLKRANWTQLVGLQLQTRLVTFGLRDLHHAAQAPGALLGYFHNNMHYYSKSPPRLMEDNGYLYPYENRRVCTSFLYNMYIYIICIYIDLRTDINTYIYTYIYIKYRCAYCIESWCIHIHTYIYTHISYIYIYIYI